MGITLQFYSGDAKRIMDDVANSTRSYLDALVVRGRHADFSLHLIPNDLGYLTEIACRRLSRPLTTLREHLLLDSPHVDEPDRGAYLVDREWVNIFAQNDLRSAKELTDEWFALMRRVYVDEELLSSSDAADAVSDLISLCKVASSNAEDEIVHVWFG